MFSLILNIIILTFFPNSLEDKLRDAISSAFPGYSKYEIKIISQKSLDKVDIDKKREIKRNANMVYVPIKFADNQGNVTENFLTCEIKLYKEVLSAKKDIAKWENLIKEDFELVLADVSRNYSFTDNYDLLNNKRAATFIKKGELLTNNKIEDVPILKSGDRVIAHSIVGNVDVNIDAISQQDGWIGSYIRIKTKNNKLFKVKVIDNINVLIIE